MMPAFSVRASNLLDFSVPLVFHPASEARFEPWRWNIEAGDQGHPSLDHSILASQRAAALSFAIWCSGSNDHHQIVPVDDLFVRKRAEGLSDLVGAHAADLASIGCRIVGQPP